MKTSLRDALSTAADNPAPPSTVDIDAALSTGHRRRVRKLSAVAVTATCILAATVSVGSAAVRAGPPPRIDPATTTTTEPPRTSCVNAPPKDGDPRWNCVDPTSVTTPPQHPCEPPEKRFVDAVRSALPPGPTWSAPQPASNCPPGFPGLTQDFSIELTDQHGVSVLSVFISANSDDYGYTRGPCDPAEESVCKTLPEGNLRYGTFSDSTGDRIVASLDTPHSANIQISWHPCVHPSSSSPCAITSTPPYTAEQFGTTALALGRAL